MLRVHTEEAGVGEGQGCRAESMLACIGKLPLKESWSLLSWSPGFLLTWARECFRGLVIAVISCPRPLGEFHVPRGRTEQARPNQPWYKHAQERLQGDRTSGIYIF